MTPTASTNPDSRKASAAVRSVHLRATRMDLHDLVVGGCAGHSNVSCLTDAGRAPHCPVRCVLLRPVLSVQVKALGAEVGVRFLTLGFEPSLTSQAVPLIPDVRAALFRAISEWVAADETEVAKEHIFSTASIQASLLP